MERVRWRLQVGLLRAIKALQQLACLAAAGLSMSTLSFSIWGRRQPYFGSSLPAEGFCVPPGDSHPCQGPLDGLRCLWTALRHGGQLPQSPYWFWHRFPVQPAAQSVPRGRGTGEAGPQGQLLRGERGCSVPVLPGLRQPPPC